jgi:hypothetical protein
MSSTDMLWTAMQHIAETEEESTTVDAVLEAEHIAQKSVEGTFLPYSKHLEKLTLVCQAMWSLLQERTGLTERDLLNRVTELDLKDGVLDGKYTKPPVDCPKCGAKMSRKFNRCLFCGQEYSDGSAFDTT